MRTMIAIAARDRAELVRPCLRSIRDAFLQSSFGWHYVLVHIDPLTTQYTGCALRDWGADATFRLDLPNDMPPKERIARMRCDAVREAVMIGFDRILYLDSDVVVSRELPAALDRLWSELRDADCRAVALGNLALYERPGYVRARFVGLSNHPASIRTHALGSCLAFPVDSALIAWSADPPRSSWDTHASTHVARNRILTSDISYVRHDGRHSGLCAKAYMGLDYQNLAADIRREGV